MHHLPNLFAIESVSHSTVLVLMFHNQDLGNTQLLNVSRIKHGPRSRQSRQERPISQILLSSKFSALVPLSEGRKAFPRCEWQYPYLWVEGDKPQRCSFSQGDLQVTSSPFPTTEEIINEQLERNLGRIAQHVLQGLYTAPKHHLITGATEHQESMQVP